MPREPWRWWVLAGAVVVIDQLSKQWIIRKLAPALPHQLTSWFNLVLAHNSGAAFSILAGPGGWQRLVLSAVALIAIGVLLFLLQRNYTRPLFCAGIGLILGGASGNLLDRLLQGTVTDFIQWHLASFYWPAFNLADSAITAGVALLLWDGWRSKTPSPQERP